MMIPAKKRLELFLAALTNQARVFDAGFFMIFRFLTTVSEPMITGRRMSLKRQ
jgi:hypothetical protein